MSLSRKSTQSFLIVWAALASALLLPCPAWSAPIQQAYLKASNTGAADWFGGAVAISGNTIVIAAPYEDGSAVGVNGNGSSNASADSGAAYVFIRSGTAWNHQAYVKASNTGAGDYFGASVSIFGDTMVVGAPKEDGNATGINGAQANDLAPDSGAAYVFVRNGTTWTQQAYLKASNSGSGDWFGVSVSLWGDTLVVGAQYEASHATGVNGEQNTNVLAGAGAAYIFVRSGTNWTQQAYLKASNTQLGGYFGNAVAISADTIVVGAYREDGGSPGVNGNQADISMTNSGAAYVFVRQGSNWTQEAYLKASSPGAFDQFSDSVAVFGDTIVIGSSAEDSAAAGINGDQNNNSAPNAGAAYVFVRNGGNWSQQAYLKGSTTGPEDAFGKSVAVWGDTIVAGVPANFVFSGVRSFGAAAVFSRVGTNWSEQAYLRASNAESGDEFGLAVGISGDTMVVGAPTEDGGAVGVNGNQGDNSASGAGAACAFMGLGSRPRLVVARYAPADCFIGLTGAPGATYRLERAAGVTGPWSEVFALTAPASGQLVFHDLTAPLGQAFYRAVQP